jgi:hypothetical protein
MGGFLHVAIGLGLVGGPPNLRGPFTNFGITACVSRHNDRLKSKLRFWSRVISASSASEYCVIHSLRLTSAKGGG